MKKHDSIKSINSSIGIVEDEIMQDFNFFSDWTSKYEYIIELGKSLPQMQQKYKTSKNLVKGCQSRVWLHGELKGNCIIFSADSDSPIPKGLVALMIKVFSGHTPQEIINSEFRLIERLGLNQNLSPTRVLGLMGMVGQIRQIAQSFILA